MGEEKSTLKEENRSQGIVGKARQEAEDAVGAEKEK